MGLATSQRHETSSYCVLMYTKCLQRITISLAVLLYLAQRPSPQECGCRDPWVWLDSIGNNAVDVSVDLRRPFVMAMKVERCI